MTRYLMGDGTVVATENATQTWEEGTHWDGRHYISLATGTAGHHPTLYRSRKGRYFLEHSSSWQSTPPSAEWVCHHAAIFWLVANDHEIPEDLRELAESISE